MKYKTALEKMKLEELKKLEGEATKNPWFHDTKSKFGAFISEGGLVGECDPKFAAYGKHSCHYNAALIVSMRNHFALMLSIIEEVKNLTAHAAPPGFEKDFKWFDRAIEKLENI
jgi:hypothetical protein